MKTMTAFFIAVVLVFSNLLTAQNNLTFRVNMNNAAGFNPAVHEVFVSGSRQDFSAGIGSFPAWPMPGSVPAMKLSDPDLDGFYTLTVPNVQAGGYVYKYFLTANQTPTWDLGEWSGDPNRLGIMGSSNTVFNNKWGQEVDEPVFSLVINEVMTSNAATISDEDGDFEDWIELYNGGNTVLDLSGYGLSDDPDSLFKWTFPQRSIAPNSYLLVWASDKNRRPASGPVHTNFKISAGNETVILTRPDGQRLDSLPILEQRTGIAYGRLPNGDEQWAYLVNPTPGAANTGPGYSRLLRPVQASHPDGFYNQDIQLSLTSPDPGAVIRYTFNGSEPSAASPLYQSPLFVESRIGQDNVISLIPTNGNPDPGPPFFEGWQPPAGEVFKINVIRARAFHPDAPDGPVQTFTYIVDPAAETRYSLPVFSLSTDNKNLFDPEIGIYVPGFFNNMFQDGWERPAHLTFFENNGQLAFKENVGIQLNGNTTRSRPRKSFRIVMRSEYGSEELDYQLFPDKNLDRFKRFLLRNSGNDWDFTVFRDGLFQSLAKQFRVETQYYRPSILFINGEYWGIHNIRDKYDEHYFETKYGIPENELTVLENNALPKWGNPDGKAHYDALVNFVTNNNLQNAANYQQVLQRMDVESFMDFQLTHIFVKNTDWPGNNALYWRYLRNDFAPAAGLRDGRWRWMILDTDFGFDLPFFYVPGLEDGAAHNTLNFATEPSGPGWPNPSWSTLLLRKLLDNSAFRLQFINRYCDLLNTAFSSAHLTSAINSISDQLSPEMAEHSARWRRPTSVAEWNNNVQVLRNFAAQRPGFQFQHLRGKFGLAAPAELTLHVSDAAAGHIRLNSIDIAPSTTGVPPLPYPWTGKYFPGVPVTARAIPQPGYRFSHWSGASGSTEAEIQINMSGAAQLTAHFEALPPADLIHFWFFGNALPNDTPLESISPTFSVHPGAVLRFQSALPGYPFSQGHPLWRKASMERRNSPTAINYVPQGNNNQPFEQANMRGIQIKQPFAANGGENTLLFTASTEGFERIRMQWAAKNEGAAEHILVDYSTDDTGMWSNSGLSISSLPLSDDYQLLAVDFSNVPAANDNPELKIRLRFGGNNLGADEGNRVTFNNMSLSGTAIMVSTEEPQSGGSRAILFPNPATETAYILHAYSVERWSLYDLSGRLLRSAQGSNEVPVAHLPAGLYWVKIWDSRGGVQVVRVVKG